MNEISPTDKTKNFDVPEALPARTKYNPKTMQDIIRTIATTNFSVKTICDMYGISTSTVYWWRAINSDISDAWRAAMVERTHIMVDSIDEEGEKLDKDCDDILQDPRTQSVKIKRFDVRSRHKQWFASRVNKKDYGDNIEVANNVTISASQAAEEAWQQARNVVDATYTDVSPTRLLNRERNTDISPDD